MTVTETPTYVAGYPLADIMDVVSPSRECETCGGPVHWDGYCRECECDVRMTRYGPECVVKGHDHEPSPEELRRWINLEDIG